MTMPTFEVGQVWQTDLWSITINKIQDGHIYFNQISNSPSITMDKHNLYDSDCVDEALARWVRDFGAKLKPQLQDWIDLL